MHMRRLTRLTNAFSKKMENFKCAVALHFAYYNFRSYAQITSDDASDGRWRDGYNLDGRRFDRAGMTERIANIQKAVEKAAECPAKHLESVAVVEGFRGQTIWQGMVEVFTLEGHVKAKRAYGWSDGENENARYTAVLEIPPVTSPNTAVRASIVAAQSKT